MSSCTCCQGHGYYVAKIVVACTACCLYASDHESFQAWVREQMLPMYDGRRELVAKIKLTARVARPLLQDELRDFDVKFQRIYNIYRRTNRQRPPALDDGQGYRRRLASRKVHHG